MPDKKKQKTAEVEEEKPAAAEGGEGASAEGAAEEKKKSPVKIIIIAVVGAVVVIGGIVAALFFMGIIGGKPGKASVAADANGAETAQDSSKKKDNGKKGDKVDDKSGKGAFYDMGEIVVNLSADGGRHQTVLQIVVQLELENPEDKPSLDAIKPRIVDNFQTYLRELRLDDLRGSAGLYRLREELLFRVSEAAYPIKIKDVLFQRMLMQ